jgi:hypothetical protein
MKDISSMHDVMCIGRRVRACTRLSEAAKALTTLDHVIGISGTSTPLNSKRIISLVHLASATRRRLFRRHCDKSSTTRKETSAYCVSTASLGWPIDMSHDVVDGSWHPSLEHRIAALNDVLFAVQSVQKFSRLSLK